MRRAMTFKEKLIIFLIIAIGFGFCYYKFVYQLFQNQIKSMDTSKIQTQLVAEQDKAAKIEQMRQVIAESEGKVTGDLSIYNNQYKEIVEMDQIFDDDGYDVSVSWSDPTLKETIVRRNVKINFSAQTYHNFKNILRKMAEMKYRCLVRNLTVSDAAGKKSTGIQRSPKLSGTIEVTFFETIDGSKSLAGLKLEDGTNADGLTAEDIANRAHAYD